MRKKKISKKQIEEKLKRRNEEKYNYEKEEIEALQKQMKEEWKRW